MDTFATEALPRTPFDFAAVPQCLRFEAAQIRNHAGGYTYRISKWDRLDRFLMLGVESGTMYQDAKELSQESVEAINHLIEINGVEVVRRLTEVSVQGKAYKQGPTLFVLAQVFARGDVKARKAAEDALPAVLRTASHLFGFLSEVRKVRGWGRSLKRAIGNWYQKRELLELAYQTRKYGQRQSFSHADVLRLAHPKADSEERNEMYARLASGSNSQLPPPLERPGEVWDFLRALERIKTADVPTAIRLIKEYHLPREVVPTGMLRNPYIWAALLPHMPLNAMIRNLGVMTHRMGKVAKIPWKDHIFSRLADPGEIRRARVHPLQILAALVTYNNGKGSRGELTWDPCLRISASLEMAFPIAFRNVEPTGKRLMIALDVSGSMTCGSIAGIPGLTPREGSAAMAYIAARTERHSRIMAFSEAFIPLGIGRNETLTSFTERIGNLPFGGTDCALPMRWALKKKIPIDAFVIYTDSETWYGRIHPVEALREYRRRMQIPAKLIVVGMVASDTSIADPDDAGMLDVVGFSTDTPTAISDFIRRPLV